MRPQEGERETDRQIGIKIRESQRKKHIEKKEYKIRKTCRQAWLNLILFTWPYGYMYIRSVTLLRKTL